MKHSVFKSRFLPFHRLIFGIAYATLENQSDAEDITQEVYAKLWQQRDTLDAIENDKAYIITITRNLSLDYYRKKVKQRATGMDELQEQISGGNDALRLEQRETVQNILKLLKTLPPMQQRVIQLRHFADLSIAEIAESLEQTEVNVRQLLSRARKTLKEKIDTL